MDLNVKVLSYKMVVVWKGKMLDLYFCTVSAISGNELAVIATEIT